MSDIEHHIENLYERCPILLDSDFKKKYPGIDEVVGFLNDTSQMHYVRDGKYSLFDERLKINNVLDYVSLIQKEDPEAISVYESVKDTLIF